MKRKLLGRLAAAAVLLLSATTATAHDFEVDGIYYNINDDGTTVSVTYKGNSYDSAFYTGAVTIPSEVTYDGKTYYVTSIGISAFSGCSSLTSVDIPNSVASIGIQAFYDCSGLTSVVIPDSVTSISDGTFYGCSGLTAVDIPNSVTSIGEYAFTYCIGLTAMVIPNNLTSIGEYAFFGCIRLTAVVIPNNLTSIGERAFSNCSDLESITVESGNNVYDSRNNCNALIETATNTLLFGFKNTIIPNSVTSIANSAFYGCSKLTSVEIPNSVESIGNDAFSYCSSLKSVQIPNSVTSIGGSTFYGCSGLTSVEIPNSVTSIGSYAFSDCSGLTSLMISNSVTSISDGTFNGCSGLTSVVIPNSVTSIGDQAFRDCSGLTEVIIPNSVKNIDSWAFWGCSSLTSVGIPNSVTYIGGSAFNGCSSLNMVFYDATNSANSSSSSVFTNSLTFVIGENVKQLPNNLISCYSNVKIVSHAAVPPVISSNTFDSNYSTVYVSSAAYPDYFLDDVWGNMSLIEIDKPVASIAFNVEDTQIGTNGSAQLTATITPGDATLKDIYWNSDNPKVARVELNGKVQGLSDGEATITAMAIDGSGVVATCHVTVGEIIAETLELDPSEITLSINKSAVITPIYTPAEISSTVFEWSSSDEGVARFKNNSDGSITVLGVADGKATITCHTTDGSDLTATCDVTVSTGTGVENTKSIAANVRGENGVICIEGADGAAVEVFNASGVCIYSGTATEIPVPQRGLYVVKVAGRANKLAL